MLSLWGRRTRDLLAQRSNHQPLFLKAEPSSQVHSTTQAIKSPTEPDQIPEFERVRWKASDGENGAFLWYFGLLCVEPKSPRQRPSRHSVLRHLK